VDAERAVSPAQDVRALGPLTDVAGAGVLAVPDAVRDAVRDAPADADVTLLDRARAGDRAAFGVLVERHHRALAAILRPRCGADVPMEDLLQEVFARALVHVGGFRGSATFLTWATSIGQHLASDWRRAGERRRRLAPTVDVADAEPSCRHAASDLRHAERRDDVDRARRALAALPGPVRAAVTLRYVEDVSYEAIAERLGAPLPRVRQWVCRGLRTLRAELEERHDAR
jgi:RNA polymerase sigma-70 factor, ECF subfamily